MTRVTQHTCTVVALFSVFKEPPYCLPQLLTSLHSHRLWEAPLPFTASPARAIVDFIMMAVNQASLP